MAGIFDLNFGTILEGAAKLTKEVGTAIRGHEPVDEGKMVELSIQLEQVKNVIPTILSQIDVAQTITNTEDAKSNSFFKSGWRPTCGWICTVALGYHYLLLPFLVFIIGMFMSELPQFPKLDTGELMTLLFGLLGLGTLRYMDKKK
jgi:hypothetical protein